VSLKDCGLVCVMISMHIGCILYAYNIILLQTTVDRLQKICNVCVKAASHLKLIMHDQLL